MMRTQCLPGRELHRARQRVTRRILRVRMRMKEELASRDPDLDYDDDEDAGNDGPPPKKKRRLE